MDGRRSPLITNLLHAILLLAYVVAYRQSVHSHTHGFKFKVIYCTIMFTWPGRVWTITCQPYPGFALLFVLHFIKINAF